MIDKCLTGIAEKERDDHDCKSYHRISLFVLKINKDSI